MKQSSSMLVAGALPGRAAGGDAPCATVAYGGGEAVYVAVNNLLNEQAEDGAQLNPVVNGRVITGQTWRVTHFAPPTALSTGRWVLTPASLHSAAKSPVPGPSRAGNDVIPVYRDCHDFPFGHYSAPFELKTHGTDRADLPLLQAISGEGRFRKNWNEFPFGKRVPSTVTAGGAARLLLVNAAAPLTGCCHGTRVPSRRVRRLRR